MGKGNTNPVAEFNIQCDPEAGLCYNLNPVDPQLESCLISTLEPMK
jgi:hypothetical protein